MTIKEEYLTNGLVVLKDFFSISDIDAIRNEAKHIFSIQLKKHNISLGTESESDFEQALYKLFNINYNAFLGAARATQQMIGLFSLTCSENIKQVLNSIGLLNPVICVKPIIYFNSKNLAKIEGHYKTPAHQDWRSMQGSLNSVVIWVPLVDMSKEIGAVEFIPGSHLHGLLDSEADEWYRHIESKNLNECDYIAPNVKKGDAVVFSAFTVHRSGNNVTEHIRWSMHVRYNDLSEATYIDRNFVHPYQVYKPDSQLVTPHFPTEAIIKNTFAL
jgi:phytanoyl-CoA hydroxylase